MEASESMNQPENKNIELQITDIVNSLRIMEFAIKKQMFTVKELAEVAPVVARLQDFVAAVEASQKASESHPQPTEGDVNV